MKAFSLYNPNWAISEIDVLIDVPVTYDWAVERVIYKDVGSVKIPLVFLQDLIEMKENTDRRQDKADIRYLKRIQEQDYGKDRI